MKLSIIAEGGVARGAYAVGVMDALYSHFGLKNVDYLTGSSSGVATLSYYAAGQFDDAHYAWVNELSSDKVLSLKNLFRGRPLADVDYLIDELIKRRVRLNTKKVKTSKMHIIVPLTNFKTGKVEYFNNKSHFDFFEILRAGMTIPSICKPVKLGNNFYCDGALSDPLPIDFREVKHSRKIIILTKPENDSKNSFVENIMELVIKWKFGPVIFKELKNSYKIYQKKMRQLKHLETKGDIIIRPTISISRFDNSVEAIMKNIEQGYNDAISNNKLSDLIETLKKRNRNYFK